MVYKNVLVKEIRDFKVISTEKKISTAEYVGGRGGLRGIWHSLVGCDGQNPRSQVEDTVRREVGEGWAHSRN